MLRIERTKRKTITLLIFVTACLLIAAATAPSPSLSDGSGFSAKLEMARFGGAIPDTGGEWIMLLFRGFLGLLLLLLPVYIVLSLVSPDGRSRLAADGILMLILLAVARFLRGAFNELPPPEQQDLSAAFPEYSAARAAESLVLVPPGWLTFIAMFLISALFALCAARIRRRFHESRPRQGTLSEELDDACFPMHLPPEGELSENEIVRLYSRMISVVSEGRGACRSPSTTPREFERRLMVLGLPPEALTTLTRLFERVRYGLSPLGREQIEAARTSLSLIEKACRAHETGCGDG